MAPPSESMMKKDSPTIIMSLPTELLLHIFAHLPKQDLTSTRQTCKYLKGPSESLLFSSITSSIFADPIPRTRMRNLLQSTNLTNLIKAIHMEPHPQPRKSREEKHELRATRLFRAVLNQVFAFPELRTAGLDLSKLPELYPQNRVRRETASLPADFMFQFFTAVWQDAEGKPRRKKVNNLELRNIPPVHFPTITPSPQFLGTMQDLEEFYLSFNHWTSPHPHNTENADYPSFPEPHAFMPKLGAIWLAHSPHLQSLRLQFKEPSGLYPKLELSGLVLPKLVTLELCNVLVTEDIVDWIAKTKTLRVLRLISCSIVTWIQTLQALDTAHNLIYGATVQNAQMCTSTRRWVDVFDKLRESLPDLRAFEMGELQESPPLSTFPGNTEEAVKYGLFSSRYKGYVAGYASVADDDFHGMLVGRDAAALVTLWRYTGQDVDANALERLYRWEVGYEEYMFGSVECACGGGGDRVDVGGLLGEED